LISEQNEGKKEEFHITLADPTLYENGIFSKEFEIKRGNYQFRFVPNGDSPKVLSIKLNGSSFSFSDDFELKGTAHEAGSSLYYTWDYAGTKQIQIPNDQELTITINPHNNILGPVSVDLVQLE